MRFNGVQTYYFIASFNHATIGQGRNSTRTRQLNIDHAAAQLAWC